MSVSHFFKIVQTVPNRATLHIFVSLNQTYASLNGVFVDQFSLIQFFDSRKTSGILGRYYHLSNREFISHSFVPFLTI